MEEIRFFVPGPPAPGGSKRAIAYKGKDGKLHAAVTDDGKRNKAWRSTVADFALEVAPEKPWEGPLGVSFTFTVARPQGHYGSGKNAGVVRATAKKHPDVKPDVLKLARSTEDALTGILWRDDSQTVRLMLAKNYGDRPGCEIRVWRMS